VCCRLGWNVLKKWKEDRYESELLGAVHVTVTDLHKIGVIDNDEMRNRD